MRSLSSTEDLCVRSLVSPDGSSYEGEVTSFFSFLYSITFVLSSSMANEMGKGCANMLTVLMKGSGNKI
jgi:hypothetical protein